MRYHAKKLGHITKDINLLSFQMSDSNETELDDEQRDITQKELVLLNF